MNNILIVVLIAIATKCKAIQPGHTMLKREAIVSSPMKCQENCHLHEVCGKWVFSNFTCTLFNQNLRYPLYFTEMETKVVFGGKKTTKDVKEGALKAFQKSVDLLNESIPEDAFCQFVELIRTLPEITRLSNESVENILLVDSFLVLNDELLEDMLLIQTIKEEHVTADIHEKDVEIRALKREESRQKSKVISLQSEIQSKKYKQRQQINDKIVANKNAEIQHKKYRKMKIKFERKERDLRSKQRLKDNAKRQMNLAKAEKDRNYSAYLSAERNYNHHKKVVEKLKNPSFLIISILIPPMLPAYIVILKYKDAASNYDYWSKRYIEAISNHQNENTRYYTALNAKNSAEEQKRQAQASLDFCNRKINDLNDHMETLNTEIELLNETVESNYDAIAKTKHGIHQAIQSQELLKRQIKMLNAEVSKLKDGKKDILRDMVKIAKMKKSVVSVHVLLQSVNAMLRYSDRKRESGLSLEWTFEDFEETVEEIFIGIKEAVATMISDSSLLAEFVMKVSISAKRIENTIRTCEQSEFGSAFHLEDM